MPLATIALALSFGAALTDFRTGRIPNWLTTGALGLGFVVQGALGQVHLAALGVLVTGATPLLLFMVSQGRHTGGGDVKLLAALGACLGPGPGLELTLLSLMLCLAFFLAQKTMRWRVPPAPEGKAGLVEAGGVIRLGPFVALAAALCLPLRMLEIAS